MASTPITDTQRETLKLFEVSGTPRSTSEVAAELDLGRRSAYGRLERLVDRGVLETKKVGASARVWWRPSRPWLTTTTTEGDELRQHTDGDILFRLLVDAVEEYAIFLLDEDGYVRTWNQGARKIKGYEADDVVGNHFATFYLDDDRAAGVPERNLAAAEENGDMADEGWRIRKDGSRFWASVTITALRDEQGEIRGFAKVTRDMTERREQENAIRRERDLIDRVFETAPVGLDLRSRDGFERVNERAAAICGAPADDHDEYPVGEPAVYDEDGEPVPPAERPSARVFETGNSITGWECQLHTSDGQRRWLSVSAAPLTDDDGDVDRVVVATEDVTQFKEHAQRVKRQRDEIESELEEVFKRVADAFCALDEEFRFTYANERAAALLQVQVGELLGECIWEVFPKATATPVWDGLHEAMETQETTEFEVYGEELGGWLAVSVYPSETGLSVYFRDITERKARERERERYETIIETVDDGIYVVDTDGYLTMVNEGYSELTGYSPERLVGMHVSELVAEETVEQARSYENELVDGERETARFEADVLTACGGAVRAEGAFSIIDSLDDGHERVGVVRDVSERVARERELEMYETIVSTIEDGIYVLDEEFHFTWVNEAYAEMTGYDREALLGAHCSLVVDEAVSEESAARLQAIADGEAGGATLEADIRRADGTSLRAESKFTRLAVGDSDEDWKVGVVRDVSERATRERELESQRERLTALNDLNRVVRALSEAAIDQSTRTEIEQAVCEGLAASDSIQYAWIGEVDGEATTIRPRAEAGTEDFLDGERVTFDLDEPETADRIGSAVRSHEGQVVADILDREDGGSLAEQADEWGFRSAAVFPITHDGSLYGVLTVFATRPGVFIGGGRDAIGHLGEIIGHAISAIEQRRALTSDEIVEMEFRVPDGFVAFDLPANDGRITFDRAVPVGDGVYLEYGTATPEMHGVLEALVENLPHWESLRYLEAGGEEAARFELRLIEPPLLSSLQAIGGYVERATIEDGDFRVRLHVAPSADIRRVTSVIAEEYPMAEMLSRRQVTRNPRETNSPSRALFEDLTDRQRAALEAAFFSGYFESPRPVSGAHLADTLGIAGPTFHQHLRKAQQTVLEHVLEY